MGVGALTLEPLLTVFELLLELPFELFDTVLRHDLHQLLNGVVDLVSRVPQALLAFLSQLLEPFESLILLLLLSLTQLNSDVLAFHLHLDVKLAPVQ